MEELVKRVSEKTGLSEEMSEVAVSLVIDFLKDKLPNPVSSQIDSVLDGKGIGDVAKGVGGLLGQ